ncbi:MAG TPA: hydantoinase/oxoprolinase family protein [Hyphomicrobiaceae bacterium]|nr:hydantoinase/oxoprolinase family protein [Hyphomicrobiaceae bacterium]
MFRIGVDIGGTFTDFALHDGAGARIAIHKQLTTPADPSRAVIEGVATLAGRNNIEVSAISEIVHGTTLVTNSVIERHGARTGMLGTAGFTDIMDMGFERRYDLFDLRITYPPPLVPRSRRLEVAERVRFDGSVETPLAEAGVRAAAKRFAEQNVEAVAVCFLHSYANAAHEQRAAEILRAEAPGLFVSASSDVFPNMREFERWTTTCVNAFTGPMFDTYLNLLESGLAGQGFRGKLYIMSSSGGMLTTSTARKFPVRALESGPAAGVLMSANHGHALALDNLLSFDMGGTTAKGALVVGAEPIKHYEMEVARGYQFRRGSGLAVRIPVIDMIEIGAGGGSIAEVDERGLLKVGPRSAGAMPGPACYAQGGTRPTLTDANLVLGYLDAEFFLGGTMALDTKAAEQAIAESVAKPLGVDTMRAAFGIHDIVSEDIARAFRIHASERAFDYRGASMVAFGGSGPLHAMAVARKLKIPRVIFPVAAGVMSALGLLVSPLAFEVARSRRVYLADLDAADFVATFAGLEAEASQILIDAGVAREDIRIVRRLDMRYQGQGHEIEVVLPDAPAAGDLFPGIDNLFGDTYQSIYTLRLEEPAEIVNWKLEAMGPAVGLGDTYRLGDDVGSESARKGTRQAYHPPDNRICEWPVYDRYALRPGMEIEGPALIEERESTCVVGPHDRVRVDDRYNLVADLNLKA